MDKLFPAPSIHSNKEISSGGIPFRVIGVLEKVAAHSAEPGQLRFIPLTTLRIVYGWRPELTVYIKAPDGRT